MRLVVSFAAVSRLVTQHGEALRDEPTNGCEGDYALSYT